MGFGFGTVLLDYRRIGTYFYALKPLYFRLWGIVISHWMSNLAFPENAKIVVESWEKCGF